MLYNVYCDETCHLEHDNINVMCIGAIWISKDKIKEVNKRILQIKARNSIKPHLEAKWVKISNSKLDFYKDLINYFFDDDDLHFRVIVIPDKTKLRHSDFNQTHDEWYHKIYFDMLKTIIDPNDTYNFYIDIKDTHSYYKISKLKEVCINSKYDFSHRIIKNMQPIRSHEVQIMQLVDILTGAIGYANRKFTDSNKRSDAKLQIVDLIKQRSNKSLSMNTLYKESKINILVWEAQ